MQITSADYEHLFLANDSSALNQHVGSLLSILQAHEEATSFEGDFDEIVAQSESLLEAAEEISEERREGINALIGVVKTVGPPVDPDEDIDDIRPKRVG